MRIDAHQHVWNLQQIHYSWLGPQLGPLFRTYEAAELAPQLSKAGIDKTILVQAKNGYDDTDYMLATAEAFDWVGGVVGWVPLDDPDEAGRRLEIYAKNPLFKGVRHLIHDEADPAWVVQDRVIEGLKVLASFNLPFDVVAVYPNHLLHVPTLAEKVPGLVQIIDHLAKPPLDDAGRRIWAEQLQRAASYPDVFAKISGLNTVMHDPLQWTAADLQPLIDQAMATFGADRLLFGSDWPVAVLAGDYQKVCSETAQALSRYSTAEIDAVFGGTAARVYRVV